MSKKVKATLSLNSSVYSDFQSFCEARALMLSRKVELIMVDITAGKIKTSISVQNKYKTLNSKQQKATLSIDSQAYSDFKKYCEANAIMLSKKIELIMINIMGEEKN